MKKGLCARIVPGVKGLGGVGIIGIASAGANAAFNATGVRVIPAD